MSYRVEEGTGDIVISGFEDGIGESPYSGLTDLKSVDIGSTPSEASVNFSTQSVVATKSYTAQTITADGSGNLQITVSGAQGDFVENRQAIVVSNSTISGFTTGTYYVASASNQGGGVELFSATALSYGTTAVLTVGNTGTATYSTVDIGRPKHFASSNNGDTGTNFVLDSNGRLWSDNLLTTGGVSITASSSWTFVGNNNFSSGTSGTAGYGNGLVYWRTAGSAPTTITGDWDGWLFIMRDGLIDYSNVNGVDNGVAYSNVGTFTYGWNPATGTTGVLTSYLVGQSQTACPHNAIVAPSGVMYFCDYYSMKSVQQADTLTPTKFDPVNTATYLYNDSRNLPTNELATCIAPFGNDFIIGGRQNQAYVWDGLSATSFSYPVLLAESFVSNIVTVNTNAYIFCGNRGNIYITNGSQANVWKKIPDHISNTIEPYFSWGGATYQKGKIYFGVFAKDNAGTSLTGYGGLWSVDVKTGALSLSNQLSYGTYAGYATALYAIPPVQLLTTGLPTNPAGTGLFIGWSPDGTNTSCGVDKTISTPYASNKSYVISDNIPIGTFLKPTASLQFEYKLSAPLLSTETVQLLASSSLGGTFVSAGTTNGSTAATIFSDNFANPLGAVQWILLKAVLNGRSSNPSYNRLKELRIIQK